MCLLTYLLPVRDVTLTFGINIRSTTADLRHFLTQSIPALLSREFIFVEHTYTASFSVQANLPHSILGNCSLSTMCYQVVERYSVCRCLYYRHAVDPCSARAQRGHSVQEKTVLVGYACADHSRHQGQSSTNTRQQPHPDSGYSSGGWSAQHEK